MPLSARPASSIPPSAIATPTGLAVPVTNAGPMPPSATSIHPRGIAPTTGSTARSISREVCT
jgi:hypothetical protein